MKRLLVAFFGLFFTSYVFADVVIFNRSKTHEIEVFYKFCKDEVSTPPATSVYTRNCGSINSVVINPEQNANKINYKILSPDSDATLIMVISALEKNESGNIIAQGKYSAGNTNSHCADALTWHDTHNVAFILDDINQSPVITCAYSAY